MTDEAEVIFEAIGNTAIEQEKKKDRILWLVDELDDDTVELTQQIIIWNLADRGIPINKRQPIILLIDSPGGLLEPALTLSDVMLASKTPVWTVNLGSAGSAGALVYVSGSKRGALENASFLLHEGEASASGTFAQLNQNFKHYHRQVEQMKRVIISRLDLSADLEQELLGGMSGKDLYLYQTPILEGELSATRYGLVNETVDNILSKVKD